MDKKSKKDGQKKTEVPERPDREFQDLRESQDPQNLPQGPPIPNIGRADLDPFAGEAGTGMIFDPNDPRHFTTPNRPGVPPNFIPSPSGMVHPPPPGARFDPFGPGGNPGRAFRGPRPGPTPGPGQGSPDPDHMRSWNYDGSPM